MRQDLHLFIGDKEVEFNGDPKILFNFKLTDLNNPTIVKNSWTKTVNINSTPANDDIFNHFWNLERTQNGVDFNAMIKTPFELYIGNTLVQNGYAKLDNVKMSNHTIQYQISLYGGLGDFFYNLSYNQGQVGDEKKTLASLQYTTDDNTTEPELSYVINKDTVKEAWDAITGMGNVIPDDKWKVINFAPVYNGIPDNFDADKVLINNRGANGGVFLRSSGNYGPIYNGSKNVSGYSLGELTEELTCDETFDYRSYLQRPVVSVNRVLKACFRPENNGGYQVKLDSHFFHWQNPYWTDGWMTLPMLRDLEVEGGETTEITGATITDTSKNRKNISFGSQTLSELDNVRLRINVGLNASEITGSVSTLYTYHYYHSNANTLNTDYVRTYTYNGGAVFMLIGRDSNGIICAKSKAYCLSSDRDSVYGHPIWDNFHVDGYPDPDEIEFIRGKWVKMSGVWRFCNMNGDRVDIEFTFPGSAPISTLEILTQTNAASKTVYKVWGNYESNDSPDISFVDMWNTMTVNDTGLKTKSQVMQDMRICHFTYNITDFYAMATDYEALFSNSYIPKDKLLGSDRYTPASFLIDYCKMFGLYFFRNPSEVADDPVSCPKGVIHIMDRDTFYTDEYIDIQDRIDRSRTMTITPTLAGSKWYAFDQEPVDSDAGSNYKKTYGYNYGRQVVNTGYNFDNNTTDLYGGSVFRSGVMVREKDKYFAMPVNNVPVYAYNGMKYSLFNPTADGLDSTELEVNKKIWNKTDINTLGLKGYDVMPRLQCHTDKNEASDGDGVLLFYRGYVQTPNDYWLTDDILEMQTVNGGNACWLMPNAGLDAGGNAIGIKTNILPHFTRDLINFGLQEGNIVNSWNFGHPQVTFSPNTYTTDGDSIYDKCWKSYIKDLYDVDGRKLNCYVNLQGIPNNEWLRKWYWFDNGIWRLNEIKEWNAADESTTQCEFIKVQDVDDYKLNKITTAGNEMIVLNSSTVPHSGGTITGQVILQSGGQWFSSDSSGVITGTDLEGHSYYSVGALRPYTGHGETTNITIVFPASTAMTPITWNICIEDDFDNWICTTVVQEGDTTPFMDFTSESEENVVSPAAHTHVLHFDYQNVNANTISASSNSTDWCQIASVDTQGKSITLTVAANTMDYMRTALITLSGTGTDGNPVSTNTHFYQNGVGMDVYPSEIDIDYFSTSGGAISIITSTDWTATINDSNGE